MADTIGSVTTVFFLLVGVALVVFGTWCLVGLRPRHRARAARMVDASAVVVDHERRIRASPAAGAGTRWYTAAVVQWSGPDAVKRRGEPLGMARSSLPPPIGTRLAVSCDPQDLDRCAIAGSPDRGGRVAVAGVVVIVVGLALLLVGAT